VVADGVEPMGLAETDPATDERRVVLRRSGRWLAPGRREPLARLGRA
jgi:hypothetical protein